MNSNSISELLYSDDISEYIDSFLSISQYKDISINFRKLSLDDDEELIIINNSVLFPNINFITIFIDKFNEIENIDFSLRTPAIQYVIDIFLVMKNILVELLALYKKAKLLSLSTFLDYDEYCFSSGIIPEEGSYEKFLSELSTDKIINFKDYSTLNYNILLIFQQLKKDTIYAKDMLYTIIDIFSRYSKYYNIIIDPYIAMDIDRNWRSKIKLIDKLYASREHIELKLKKYWNDYIESTKITIFLQTLIQNSGSMIVKAEQDNDIETVSKLDNTIKALSILSQSYNDNITNKLLNVVYYLKMEIFLSELYSEVYDNM